MTQVIRAASLYCQNEEKAQKNAREIGLGNPG